jgi:hypothetical protein
MIPVLTTHAFSVDNLAVTMMADTHPWVLSIAVSSSACGATISASTGCAVSDEMPTAAVLCDIILVGLAARRDMREPLAIVVVRSSTTMITLGALFDRGPVHHNVHRHVTTRQ